MWISYVLLLSLWGALQAGSSPPTQTQEETESVDIWFGPGFYYGLWFENEEEYQEWRGNHRDYPPNRGYYNHDRPVPYHRDGGGRGGPRGGGAGRR